MQFIERHNLTLVEMFQQHFSQILSTLLLLHFVRININLGEDRLLFGPRSWCAPVLKATEELFEAIEVVLRPLVERVLVALGTLDANAHERVSKAQRPLFRLLKFTTHPESRERRLVGEVSLCILVVVAAHPLTVFGVRLVFRTTDGEDDSFHHVVIRHVLFDADAEPFVPVRRHAVC